MGSLLEDANPNYPLRRPGDSHEKRLLASILFTAAFDIFFEGWSQESANTPGQSPVGIAGRPESDDRVRLFEGFPETVHINGTTGLAGEVRERAAQLRPLSDVVIEAASGRVGQHGHGVALAVLIGCLVGPDAEIRHLPVWAGKIVA
jgi:hypothetical protein